MLERLCVLLWTLGVSCLAIMFDLGANSGYLNTQHDNYLARELTLEMPFSVTGEASAQSNPIAALFFTTSFTLQPRSMLTWLLGPHRPTDQALFTVARR